MRLAPLSLALIFVLGHLPGIRAQDVPAVPDIREHRVTSTNVEEEYFILVSLPDGYSTSQHRYPVLFVLDAEKSFGLVRDVTDWLAWGRETPSMIVVGISYGESTQAWWQKRSRDLTPSQDESRIWGEWPLAGGADAFRRFLGTELIPFIEREYRTDGSRTLVGLSLGGLFGAHDLLSPDRLFHRYILVSPAFPWNYDGVLRAEAGFREGSASLPASVYSAVGTADEEAILQSWHRFNSQVEGREYEGLSFYSEAFEGETHLSVFPIAVTHGLKWAFQASR